MKDSHVYGLVVVINFVCVILGAAKENNTVMILASVSLVFALRMWAVARKQESEGGWPWR